jgi:hypothetical protein
VGIGRKPICRPLFLANRRLEDDDDVGVVVSVVRKALAFARRHTAVTTVVKCFIVCVWLCRNSFPPWSTSSEDTLDSNNDDDDDDDDDDDNESGGTIHTYFSQWRL